MGSPLQAWRRRPTLRWLPRRRGRAVRRRAAVEAAAARRRASLQLRSSAFDAATAVQSLEVNGIPQLLNLMRTRARRSCRCRWGPTGFQLRPTRTSTSSSTPATSAWASATRQGPSPSARRSVCSSGGWPRQTVACATVSTAGRLRSAPPPSHHPLHPLHSLHSPLTTPLHSPLHSTLTTHHSPPP